MKRKGNHTHQEEIASHGVSRRSFLKAAAIGSAVTVGGVSLPAAANAMHPWKKKTAAAATLGMLKRHQRIDDIIEVKSDYMRFDQINLLFSNVSSFNPRTNDPNDPDHDERQRIRQSFGLYVAKADGVGDIMRAIKKEGGTLDDFIRALGIHSIPFPPPFAKMLWEDEAMGKAIERSEKKGWSQLDYAFENAGWSVDHFGARLSEGGALGVTSILLMERCEMDY